MRMPPPAHALPPTDNPFGADGAGALYARGRPYHHPVTLARALEILGVARTGTALDVACGTGLSTRALAGVSDWVVGCELSAEMLRAAPRLPNAAFVRAAAECLPFGPGTFDAVTVASAVHWFDQDRFFSDAHRVLRAGGWLVCYDHYFLASVRGVPESDEWGRELFARYPLPARGRSTGERDIAPGELFEVVGEDFFDNDQDMTLDTFVDYVCSQSNAITATRRGERVREWVARTAAAFFASGTRPVRFGSVVTCLRHRPA